MRRKERDLGGISEERFYERDGGREGRAKERERDRDR